MRGGTGVGTRPSGATMAGCPEERAGFIGIPRSSGASAILRSSVSGLLRVNMDGASHQVAIGAVQFSGRLLEPKSGGRELRRAAPQAFEEVHHERGGNQRRDEVDERHSK